MSDRGALAELTKYAQEQIDAAKEKNSNVHDDLLKYQKTAIRKEVWEDVVVVVAELRKKHLTEDDE